MKKLLTILAAVMLITMMGLGSAQADSLLAWQTAPIMGYNVSDVTGDVVVTTGPTPTKPGGGFYYDVDGNVVLGPTIPHYNLSGDPLYGVGSPSVTQFYYNPNTFTGGHWTDTVTQICSGSGIYLDANHSYTWTSTYSFLGTPGNSPYAIVSSDTYVDGGDAFIMLMSGINNLWLEDAGSWKYTETWTDNNNPSLTITSTRDFTATAVPIPGAVWLLGSGLAGLGFYRQRRAAFKS